MHTLATDDDLLRYLGRAAAPLLGAGGEARVYDLGDGRIARIPYPGAEREPVLARAELLAEVYRVRGEVPFQTPEVLDIVEHGGRIAMLERRLDGVPLSSALRSASGQARARLLASYLETSLRLQDIQLTRDWFGPLIGDPALRASRWHDFLKVRLRRSSATCPPDLRRYVLDPANSALPDAATPRLVHLDYFPDNVLVDDGRVTAVLDFSASALAGDPRLDAWSAVAYLDEEISPAATAADRHLAGEWLEQTGLARTYPNARLWLAAYWSHAADDAALMRWCRRVLGAGPG